MKDKIEEYVSIKLDIAKKKAELTKMQRECKKRLDEIELSILASADEQGIESFRTSAGVAYITIKKMVSVEDQELRIKYAMENNDYTLFTKNACKQRVLELIEDGVSPSDFGVKYQEERIINVRK
ncbi:MAG: hypothetical protein DRQ35_01390 [Gammaproteobacteria bacterium]|nr:MAG: hypothetical protein DRQ35_01390 [Gammaproteobacteria bacterium]